MQRKDMSSASSAEKYSWWEMCYAQSGNTEEKIATFQAQEKKKTKTKKPSCCIV